MIQTIKAYEHIRDNLQMGLTCDVIPVHEAIKAVEIAEKEISNQFDNIEAVKDKARRNAIEVYKHTCPSRNNKGCASYTHSRETKNSKCDGNCKRIKLFNNLLDRAEL